MQGITVGDVMAKHPRAIRAGTSLPEVVDTLLAHHLPGLPVVNESNHVVGFVSEQDCLGHLLGDTYYDQGAPAVEDVMTREAMCVEPDHLLVDLAERMLKLRPKTFPVVQEGQLVGMISRSLVVQAFRKDRDAMDRKK